MLRNQSIGPFALFGLSLIGVVSNSALASGPPVLTIVGTFGGAESGASGSGQNGQVVVGTSSTPDSAYHAYLWTQVGGMQDLGNLGGTLLDGRTNAVATGVSSDGAVVVGGSLPPNTLGAGHAYRWTLQTGMTDLGTLGGRGSEALGISRDGSTVVGQADLPDRPNPGSPTTFTVSHAFRWTAATGKQDLGVISLPPPVPPGATSPPELSSASAASRDGSVVTGQSTTADGTTRPFRWTASAGMRDLGTIGGSWGESEAISDDGSVIGGSCYVAGSTTAHAFRWTAAAGIQDLGTLPDNPTGFSGVKSMTASGAVLVGVDFPPNGNYRAFLWSEKTGMINLNTYLAQQGLNLTGWSKFAPSFISADGTHLVGHGLYNNVDVSFIISNFSLSSPAPATPVSLQIALALALVAAGAMLPRRQRLRS